MTNSIQQEVRVLTERGRKISQLGKTFFSKKQSEYHTIGLAKLHQDVYLRFQENPSYSRTRNLLMSYNSEKDDSSIRIFLDPTRAEIDAVMPSGFGYYPSYVSMGIFFRHKGTPRNIAQGWEDVLGKKFINDVEQEIGKAVRV